MEKRGVIGVFAILSLVLVISSVILYILVNDETHRTIALIMAGVFLLLSIVFLITKLTSKEHKIKNQLAKVNSLNSLDLLKRSYGVIYGIYMTLSEKDKQNYYHKVTKLREFIEEKMHADKQLELLVQEASKGNIEEKKKLYKKMNENFQKLPLIDQNKYTSHLAHLREEVGETSSVNPENLKNDLTLLQKNGN